MRVYRGRRDEGPPERAWIVVEDTEIGRTYELVERPYPNTAGLEWGYSGAGPHNSARAILDDLLGSIPEWVGEFERDIVSRLRPGFDLPDVGIYEWIDTRGPE